MYDKELFPDTEYKEQDDRHIFNIPVIGPEEEDIKVNYYFSINPETGKPQEKKLKISFTGVVNIAKPHRSGAAFFDLDLEKLSGVVDPNDVTTLDSKKHGIEWDYFPGLLRLKIYKNLPTTIKQSIFSCNPKKTEVEKREGYITVPVNKPLFTLFKPGHKRLVHGVYSYKEVLEVCKESPNISHLVEEAVLVIDKSSKTENAPGNLSFEDCKVIDGE